MYNREKYEDGEAFLYKDSVLFQVLVSLFYEFGKTVFYRLYTFCIVL